MKKFTIKKIHLISIILLIIGFISSVILGFTAIKVPELISSTIKNYKFLLGMRLFCFIMPAIVATGYVIGWSIDFGKNQSGSLLRFSPAMMGRFKSVMINSLIGVLFMVCCDEIFTPILNEKLFRIAQLPGLMREYQNNAENYYNQERYETAYQFARLANEIDPGNKTNKELLYKTEIAETTGKKIKSSLQGILNSIDKDTNLDGSNIVQQKRLTEPFTSYELLKQARYCIKIEDWFGAHYYAQTALEAINPKDINIAELKDISSKAWNQISSARRAGTTETQKIFAKKYEGYTALLENDVLKAYYIFKTLHDSSKKLSLDPDIIRYLTISEQRLEKQYFFIDETFNLQGFEQTNDVYFKYTNSADASTNLYFIKGVTTTGRSPQMVQYLRGMTIVNIDARGEYRSGIYIPYARMTTIQTEYFTDDIKERLGIDPAIKAVPYILLKSVDRKQEGVTIDPVFKGGYQDVSGEGFIICPIEANDFELIKKASMGAKVMDLFSLIPFVNKAVDYGFSAEIYGQDLMNRLLKPLYLLIILVLLAWLSWHMRTNEDSLFKFQWIVMFPLLALSFMGLYKLMMRLFQLLNYALFAIFGQKVALLAGIIFYSLLLIFSSVCFVASRNTEGK